MQKNPQTIRKLCLNDEDMFTHVSVTGYCTEYNEIGTVIQAHHNLKCENVKPPCDSSYLSTESYRRKIFSFSYFFSLSYVYLDNYRL